MFRRIAWVCILLIVGGLVGYLIFWLATPSTVPTAPSDTTTQATVSPTPAEALPTQIGERDATEIPTADSKPIPTYTEPPIPKEGDKRGCPLPNGKVDVNDPNCLKRNASATYNKHYAGKSAFECNDGRNDGLGAKDLNKFVPCINSSLRLEVSSSNSKLTLYQSTTPQVKLLDSKPDVTNPRPLGKDWLVWKEREGSGYKLCVSHDRDLEFFGIYVRNGATGNWERTVNCAWYQNNTAYKVVVFWNDPAKPDGDAPLPPAFSWKTVAKH